MARQKRYTPEQVDEAIRQAIATCLGMCCSVLRLHNASDTPLEAELKDAHVRAAELHSARALGQSWTSDQELAGLLPSKALADGMAEILCREVEP